MPSSSVGVPVVENVPNAGNRSPGPGVAELAGSTKLGAALTSVSVVEDARAVPAAVGCGELSSDSQTMYGMLIFSLGGSGSESDREDARRVPHDRQRAAGDGG